ncbi:MAG: hypothetical protein FWG82_07170 [Oscillospiraceae bacterium]|nr:hypothetical protein [Oscillospiraceae bacterium]
MSRENFENFEKYLASGGTVFELFAGCREAAATDGFSHITSLCKVHSSL